MTGATNVCQPNATTAANVVMFCTMKSAPKWRSTRRSRSSALSSSSTSSVTCGGVDAA